MIGTERRDRVFLRVEMTQNERKRFNAVCGPGQPMKRGAWVREAILAHLAVEEATDRAIAARTGGRKGAG